MIENKLICYVCNQEIKTREEAVYIGKDKFTQKELLRHRKCSPLGLEQSKIRRTQNINPKTKIKESDTKYNRNKDKQKLRKEMKDI